MIHIIAYDIHFTETGDRKAARRLSKLAKLLTDYGWRRQLSQFECDIQPQQAREIRDKARLILDEKVDSMRIYPVCVKCLKNVAVQGTGDILAISDFAII